MGLNHLADLTPDEFRQMNDLLERPDEGIPYVLDDQFPKRGQVPIVDYAVSNQTFPENLDWREYGKCKLQTICFVRVCTSGKEKQFT